MGRYYYSNSSSRDVETRTVYRYCTRNPISTYYYYRWKDWSAWSTTTVFQSNTKEVETATFYRYRDRVTQPTYYFQRWTEWSEYFESPVGESDTVEVRTKTQYRYHSKWVSNISFAFGVVGGSFILSESASYASFYLIFIWVRIILDWAAYAETETRSLLLDELNHCQRVFGTSRAAIKFSLIFSLMGIKPVRVT